MINLLRHLPRERYRPAVILLRPGPLEAELRGHGLDVRVLHRHRMRNVLAIARAILQIHSLVQSNRLRLLHSNGFRTHPYGGLAARLAQVPEVWSVHAVERPSWSTEVIARLPTSHVIGNCRQAADYFAGRGIPTSLVWPAVEVIQHERALKRSELAKQFGLPDKARWILVASRLQRFKGQHYLIHALAALGAEFKDVHAIIAGGALFGMEEDYAVELRRLADALGVSDRVHFVGFIAEPQTLGSLILQCELMVHPALEESFGLSVAEAQALGRPVLAFAATGPMAIIEEGKTGHLVAIGDQMALNRRLAEMLADSARLAAMGAAGADRVNRLFSAKQAAIRLGRIYDAVLAGRQPCLGPDLQPLIEEV